MKTFSGFPSSKADMVDLPLSVFTELIPLIDDLYELKLTLHILWRLGQQRGSPRYLRLEDLIADEVLLSSLRGIAGETSPTEAIASALERAVERGTLLRVESQEEGEAALYLANTPAGRTTVEAISQGKAREAIAEQSHPNIFTLYEQNIGMLSPLIAEQLREAEQVYPPSWIEDAFREAVSLNKRSWRYIHAILKRWSAEGKDAGRGGRPGEIDRRRYLEWKNG